MFGFLKQKLRFKSSSDKSSSANDKSEKPHKARGELVMYIIVNTSLKMGRGKIAAQAVHGAIEAYRKHNNRNLVKAWLNQGQPVIALAVSDTEALEKLQMECTQLGLVAEMIADAGRTQVEPGSRTVLGVGPIYRNECPESIRSLKLL